MVSGEGGWGNRVEVTDAQGWRKEFPLDRPLLYIGSDPRSDVVLDAQRGSGVAHRHLQLIALPAVQGGDRGGYRAINLSDQAMTIGQVGGRLLSPRAAVEIVDGDTVRVGDFVLVFRLGAVRSSAVRAEPAPPAAARAPAAAAEPAVAERHPIPAPRQAAAGDSAAARAAAGAGEAIGVEDHSAHIGLKLSLPGRRIEPEFPLEGSILVCNLGDEQGVQFRIAVEGLHDEMVQVGPGPILFPKVEKGVYLRLRHPRGPALPAGRHEIRIRATAPDVYPGEEVCVTHELEVVPYYHHTLALTVLD